MTLYVWEIGGCECTLSTLNLNQFGIGRHKHAYVSGNTKYRFAYACIYVWEVSAKGHSGLAGLQNFNVDGKDQYM